jgi:hypothetical protein
LAATWFSGRAETLQAHVAGINIHNGATPPTISQSTPFQVDWWQKGASPEVPLVRGTGGEYVAVAFLRSGGLAVVSPIANSREQRFGFSWWRLEAR